MGVAAWGGFLYNKRDFLPHFFMELENKARLLEILSVVVGLAVVSGVIFVAFVRPRQEVVAVKAQNDTNVVAIHRALEQARNDAGGDLSSMVVLPGVLTPIGSGAGEVNLCRVLVPSYLATMPYKVGASDEVGGGVPHYVSCDDYETGYHVMRDAAGVVSVE